jgi:DNA-binding response OmpR family regulator
MNRNTRKKILIIDNDGAVRQALVQMVQVLGHQPIALDRAMGAAKLLLEGSVDAMLLDLHMPGPHGEDLLRYLRKKNVSVPPTIVVSGYLHREAIGELIRLGVAGIIAKPFDPRRLQDELGRILEGREGRFFFCPHCGAAAQPADRFCRQCGTSLETPRACPQCQTMHGPADRFCGECGAKLGKAAEEPSS